MLTSNSTCWQYKRDGKENQQVQQFEWVVSQCQRLEEITQKSINILSLILRIQFLPFTRMNCFLICYSVFYLYIKILVSVCCASIGKPHSNSSSVQNDRETGKCKLPQSQLIQRTSAKLLLIFQRLSKYSNSAKIKLFCVTPQL